MSKSTTLITAVATAFSLPNDIFTDMFLEEHIGCVRVEHQETYFKDLFKEDTGYRRPLEIISAVTKQYRKKYTYQQHTNATTLVSRIGIYLKAVVDSDNEKLKGLELEERLKRVRPEDTFPELDMKVINLAGGLSVFIPNYEAFLAAPSINHRKIEQATIYLEKFYIDIFFGEEPNQRIASKD